MDTTLHGDILLPEHAVGSTSSHSTQEEVVDLNDLSYLVRGDVSAHGGSGINSNQDSALELESQSGSTLCEISHLGSQRFEVSLELHLLKAQISWLREIEWKERVCLHSLLEPS